MKRHETIRNSSRELGQHLFTIAIIADTHLNEADMESTSAFKVNLLANGRMRFVVCSLNALKPDFVINLGDLVHPVPVLSSYAEAVTRFHEQTEALTCKQYLVPGNHDVGDKPIKWGPMGVVCDEYLALWERHFGKHYYGFDYKECHFIVINAQIINSGLASEGQQKTWLERDLDEHKNRRLFVNIHYPPYLTHPEELEHYDNIAEPGRSWLLGLLVKYKVEALFAGHVHNFWYYRHGETDCYLLPSTAFVRQDYSEMYDIEPADEYGRNDSSKLGYFIVDVYEHGHICRPIRTCGTVIEKGGQLPVFKETVRSLHPIENYRAPLGFDLRLAWAALKEIAPSGALDEFNRKVVRNDYPLLALWEMGIRKLRVPLQDLVNENTRERIRALQRMGHEFTVYTFEIPTGALRDTLIAHQDLVAAWEITVAQPDFRHLVSSIREIKDATGIPIFISKLRLKGDLEKEGLKYHHVINHGFIASEVAEITDMLSYSDAKSVIDGFVFRVVWRTSPWRQILAVGELMKSLGLCASIHLRLAGDYPTETRLNDKSNAARVAEGLCAAMTQSNVVVFLDTLVDVDRGYFPRNGVLDRRCNPKIGSRVIKHLYGTLNNSPEPLAPIFIKQINGGQSLAFTGSSRAYLLLMPDGLIEDNLATILGPDFQNATAITATDLDTGIVTTIAWPCVKGGDVGNLVTQRLAFENPTLLTIVISQIGQAVNAVEPLGTSTTIQSEVGRNS